MSLLLRAAALFVVWPAAFAGTVICWALVQSAWADLAGFALAVILAFLWSMGAGIVLLTLVATVLCVAPEVLV